MKSARQIDEALRFSSTKYLISHFYLICFIEQVKTENVKNKNIFKRNKVQTRLLDLHQPNQKFTF